MAQCQGTHHPGQYLAPALAPLCPDPGSSPGQALNPVENVWAYLRANKLAITVFNTYDAIVDACCKVWNFFANDPKAISSHDLGQRSIERAIGIRRALYMPALVAIRFNRPLKPENPPNSPYLPASGNRSPRSFSDPPQMRRIIAAANARRRDYRKWTETMV